MAGVGGWRWEVGGNYQPPEFWMPEHMADPDWNPFLRIVSAEQSSDKACFADIKKRNTHPLSMSGTSGSEINNETSPGKDRSIFSLLPFTPAAAGQPKGCFSSKKQMYFNFLAAVTAVILEPKK